MADGFELGHHGDLEVGGGLVDLAVNVRSGTPPAWLVQEIAAASGDLASYPRQDSAIAALAARHGCGPDQLLVTAGAAEAFVLVARAFRPRHAVVVHPQFTEPEVALRSAGHLVDRVILRAEEGFGLDPRAVPESADLVVVGNPTNPTSILHPAADLRELARPDRILVVDEAFMDAVPGEPESLVGAGIPGLVVIRSLTKTWGLAGLRVGYVVAAPSLIEQMRAVQPQWPVSTPALSAIVACSTPRATTEAAKAAVDFDRQRAHLLDALQARSADLRSITHPPTTSAAPSNAAPPAMPGTPSPAMPETAPRAIRTTLPPVPGTMSQPEPGAPPAVPGKATLSVPRTTHQGLSGAASAGLPETAVSPVPGMARSVGQEAAGSVGIGEGSGKVAQVLTYGVPRGPFVLVRVAGAAGLRERLRERGYAVRRGDTFPGLGSDWLRIAVRPAAVVDEFAKVWHELLRDQSDRR